MEPLVLWLLTYLVHSTLLLGAAGLARFALRERRLALQEAVLRAALVGGFVTASLQIGLELHPLGGALAVPGPRPALAAPGPSRVGTATPHLRPGRPVVEREVPAWAEAAAAAVAARWRTGLVLVWAGLAAAALARLGVASRRLRRLLRDRRPIDTGELAPEAARLGVSLGLRRAVRLSATERLAVPLATGVLRPEVCRPARAVAELAADEQVALCAHELAHVARRDPAWVLLARLAEAAAPVQPLNAWARRRLQDLAECLSDDLAVRASGRPLGLARSLVDVASWTLGERPLFPVAAAGALSARSRLGHRVERLMDPFRALERPRRLLLPAAAAAVLATALVSPVVSGSVAPQEPKPAPEAQPAPRAETAPSGDATPQADAASTAEARERLERLSRRIEERARLHDAEMKKLEAEIEAITSKVKPNEAEMERHGREIEKAAQELAASVRADVEAGTGAAKKSERTAEAARRMAEAEDRLRETARAIRMPSEEIRALADKARAIAESVRPTDDELGEIRRLSAEAARQSVEQSRDAMRIAEEALRQAREALREVREKP